MTDTLAKILEMLPGLNATDLGRLKDAVTIQHRDVLHQAGIAGELTEYELELLGDHNVMGVVKSIRDRTGLGLRDAKAYMDRARGMKTGSVMRVHPSLTTGEELP